MNRKKRFFAGLLAAAMVLSLAGCAKEAPVETPLPTETGLYTPGAYTAQGKGMGGDVTVEVTVDANAITAVKVLEHKETAGISDPAIAQLPDAIVKANSPEVEAVSGATLTSNAIKEAVGKALAAARGEAVEEPEQALSMPFDAPDVIVIGAGSAGINTAVAAADNGANVLLIEKTAERGGSGRIAGGTLSGAGTKMQKEAGITDTPELLYAEIEKRNADIGGTDNYNVELAKFYAANSGAAVDWLDELGADMGDRSVGQPSLYQPMNVARVYSTGKTASYLAVVGALLDAHVEQGHVAVFYETEVQNLLMEDGAVVGVHAKLPDGTEQDYRAPAVVMCTGGYGHSEELLNRYNFKNCLTTAPSYITGDGFRFAEEAGGVLKNMDYCSTYAGGIRNSASGFTKTANVRIKDFPYFIMVGADGNRMIDELGREDGSSYDGITACWKKGDNTVYLMLDEGMIEALRADGKTVISGDKDWSKWEDLCAKGEEIFIGDTVEAAAKSAGIDGANLAATIERYNGFVEAGKDADFGRTRLMKKFENGPFYIIRTIPYVMITSGGPWMNDQCQVLHADGTPIKGLYQAGELVGNANICGHTTFGGIQNTGCVVWGKQAGKNAANEK